MAELSLDQVGAVAQGVAALTPTAPDAQPPLQYTAPQALPQKPRDRTALDDVAHSVEMTESGGKQSAVSPKGAIGVMQLMPGTAKQLGVDPNNEQQNREGGKRYLGELYDRYGNWDQALVAYNWGPENADKWVSKGADPAKLPDETKNYLSQVLTRAGLSTNASTSVLQGKRELSKDEIGEVAETLGKRPSVEAEDSSVYGDDAALTAAMQMGAPPPEFGEQTEALLQGARKGVQNLVLGPIQLGLEATNPRAAAIMTDRVNELEERFGQADLQRKHPFFSGVGEAVSTATAIMASGGMLGATKAGQAVSRAIPSAIRMVSPTLGGAALGVTSYNPDESTSRVAEGVLGALGGEFGRFLGKSAAWATRSLADRSAYKTALQAFQQATAGVGRNVAEPRDNFLSRVQALWAKNNQLYAGRTASGRGFEGFDSQSMRDALTGPMKETRLNGVAVAPGTRTGASRAYEELGLREEDARKAAADAAVAQYNKAREAWDKTYAAGIPEGSRTQVLARDIDSGRIPPPPQPPEPYVPEPIQPSRYSAALTAVNRALRSAKGRDPAAFRQLSNVRDELQAAASAHAAELGVPVETFLRRSEAANKFYQENIVPIYKAFGFKNPTTLAEDLTPAKFFDKVTGTIEKGDKVEIERMAKMLGAGGQEDMRRATLFRMLTKGQDGKEFDARKAVAYVQQNKEGLQAVFGRDGADKLLGWAKIADRVTANPAKHRTWLAGTKSWLPFVGLEEIIQGGMHGSLGRAAMGAGLIVTPYASHALFTAMERMEKVPGVLPLVRSAAKLSPESPQLETLIKVIEARYRRAGLALGREGAEQSPF